MFFFFAIQTLESSEDSKKVAVAELKAALHDAHVSNNDDDDDDEKATTKEVEEPIDDSVEESDEQQKSSESVAAVAEESKTNEEPAPAPPVINDSFDQYVDTIKKIPEQLSKWLNQSK